MWTVLAESLHLHACRQSQAPNATADFPFRTKNNRAACIAGAFIVEFPSSRSCRVPLGASGRLDASPPASTGIGGRVGIGGSGDAPRRTLTPRPAPAGEGDFSLGEGDGDYSKPLTENNTVGESRLMRNHQTEAGELQTSHWVMSWGKRQISHTQPKRRRTSAWEGREMPPIVAPNMTAT